MMLEAQKQPPQYDISFAGYSLMSSASLPPIDNIKSEMVNSTSENVGLTYKYWNPATIDDSSNSSHVQSKTVDQLIGELDDESASSAHDPDSHRILLVCQLSSTSLLFFDKLTLILPFVCQQATREKSEKKIVFAPDVRTWKAKLGRERET